jgi:hypothetical protein
MSGASGFLPQLGERVTEGMVILDPVRVVPVRRRPEQGEH